ncbi:hypothetical protein [Spiroplasma endosymbiont of Cantharis nigra]|uniref:hypothetical protein n=1 Tax=Spiroplasma endosymbiont of Cantharis nigra TaxID=3066278 RepID=UPI0030CFC554
MPNQYGAVDAIKESIRIEFGNDISEKELVHFQKFVIKIINTEHIKLGYLQLDKDDFTSHVFFALKEIKNKFDINRKVPLLAYANFIIKRRILDYAKYLKRDKRKITLLIINSFRSGLTEEGQTFIDRDIDRFSLQKYNDEQKNLYIRETLKNFIKYECATTEANMAKMLYKGYSQKEIIEKLKIKRKDFLEFKEKLKSLFKGFIKDTSNI